MYLCDLNLGGGGGVGGGSNDGVARSGVQLSPGAIAMCCAKDLHATWYQQQRLPRLECPWSGCIVEVELLRVAVPASMACVTTDASTAQPRLWLNHQALCGRLNPGTLARALRLQAPISSLCRCVRKCGSALHW